MEVEHNPAQESDTQTSPVLPNIHIRAEMCNTVESTEIKQEPKFHGNDNPVTFDENSKYSGDMGIRVDVKTEVSDSDECELTDNIHKSPHGGDASYVNCNYVGRYLICDNAHVVKSEPADECLQTTDNTFSIEIDTCKDEYYERHGYPTNDFTVNTLNKKAYNCHMCERSFTHTGHLADHIRTHTGEKAYVCSVCGVGFTQKGHLQSHIRIHTGEKSHKCSVCEISFRHKHNLTQHMRTHTGEKPHKCSVCGVAFKLKSHLTVHMRRHTGEKPHKCPICGASFVQKCSLQKHTIIHTGEKLLSHNCSL